MPNATCKHCFAPLAPGAAHCGDCGRAVQGSSKVWLIAGASAIALLALTSTLRFRPGSRPSAPNQNPHVAKEIKAGQAEPALVVPNVFQLGYVDRGDKVELSVDSSANPVLYVDVNQNGRPDAGDLSYATDGHSPCVRSITADDDSGPCNDTPSRATVRSQQSEGMNRVTWIIPKQELQNAGGGTDFAIELFDPAAQKGQYYPDNPLFGHVYRLVMEPNDSAAMPPQSLPLPPPPPQRVEMETPVPRRTSVAKAAAPQIDRFEANPTTIAAGGTAKLDWSVSNGDSVEIDKLGNVALNGEQNVSPAADDSLHADREGPGRRYLP